MQIKLMCDGHHKLNNVLDNFYKWPEHLPVSDLKKRSFDNILTNSHARSVANTISPVVTSRNIISLKRSINIKARLRGLLEKLG